MKLSERLKKELHALEGRGEEAASRDALNRAIGELVTEVALPLAISNPGKLTTWAIGAAAMAAALPAVLRVALGARR